MSLPGVVIRKYDSRTDRAGVDTCFIALQDHEHEFSPEAPTGDELVGQYVPFMLTRCAQPGSALFVADLESRVVGFASALVRPREEPDDVDPLFVELAELGVVPEHRGKGIGEALVAEVERHAKDLGAPCLRVRVHAWNEGARRLYRRLGLDDVSVTLSKRLGGYPGLHDEDPS